MAEIITVPVSPFQQKQLAAIQAQAAEAQKALNVCVTAIVAAQHDPDTMPDWDIRLVGSEIVCTPPKD